jgi:hypothetical protein
MDFKKTFWCGSYDRKPAPPCGLTSEAEDRQIIRMFEAVAEVARAAHVYVAHGETENKQKLRSSLDFVRALAVNCLGLIKD